jgi:hypothetical protein
MVTLILGHQNKDLVVGFLVGNLNSTIRLRHEGWGLLMGFDKN